MTDWEGRSVLVAGGLGFIGSHLVDALVDAGSRVVVIDALVPNCGGRPEHVAPIADRVDVHIADVRDAKLLASLVRDQEVIFNLVGRTSHLDSMHAPGPDLEANCAAQLSLLEACRRHNRNAVVVFAGTRQVYGRPRYLPADEVHPIEPVDINGIHKWAGEAYHLLYHRVHGIAACVLRLTNTYGPRMRVKDDRHTFLGAWLRQVLTGEELVVMGTGSQRRDLTYVDDAVAALLRAATTTAARGCVYNIGGGEVVSLLDLAKKLVRLAGDGSYRLEPFPPERRVIDIGDYFADASAAGRELGWIPRIPIEEGLSRSLRFFSDHPEYWCS